MLLTLLPGATAECVGLLVAVCSVVYVTLRHVARRMRSDRILYVVASNDIQRNVPLPPLPPYEYPAVLANGHAMTIATSVLRPPPPHFAYARREPFRMHDGGVVYVDWLCEAGDAVVLVVHGVTGGSGEAYVQWQCASLAAAAAAAGVGGGLAICALNFRGCNNTTLHTERAYSAYQTDDLHTVLLQLRTRYRRFVGAVRLLTLACVLHCGRCEHSPLRRSAICHTHAVVTTAAAHVCGVDRRLAFRWVRMCCVARWRCMRVRCRWRMRRCR